MARLKVSKETEKYLNETSTQLLYDLFHYWNGKLIFKAGKEAFEELKNTDKNLVNLVYDILTKKVTVYSSAKYVLVRNIVTEDYGDFNDIAPLYWNESMLTMEYDQAQVLDEEEDKLKLLVLVNQGWTKKEVYNY